VAIRPLFKKSPMLISLPFGNYGGFLLPRDAARPVSGADLGPLREFFARSDAFALEIRETDAPAHDLQTETTFVRYELQVPEDLAAFWKSGLTGNTRNMIRKGERLGVEAVFDHEHTLEEFERINERCAAYFGTPTHHARWYPALARLFAAESEIVLGRYQGKTVGALYVLREGRTAMLHAALTDPAYRHLPVQDQLLWRYIERSMRDGREPPVIDFGRTRPDSAKRFFKRRWGTVERTIHYSYLLKPGMKPPQILPDNPKFGPAIVAWRHLPRPIQRAIGPRLRVRIPT
jgi:hypothetical protein